MVSLMNGLSSMGAGVAAYAGTAGLEAQKADLQQQAVRLSDQLQGARESAGRQEAAGLAATAAAAQHGYALEEQAPRLAAQIQAANIGASATIGAANISAEASKENVKQELAQSMKLLQPQIDAATANAGMAKDQQALAHTSFELSAQLGAELAKPPDQQDQAKIANLYNQRQQIGMTPDVQAKFLTAIDGQVRATTQQLIGTDNAIGQITRQLATMDIDDKGRPAQEAELKSLQNQRDGVSTQLTILQRSQQTYMPRSAGAPGTPAATDKTPPSPSQFYTPPGSKPAKPPEPYNADEAEGEMLRSRMGMLNKPPPGTGRYPSISPQD
jgi:hypothetical protein